MNRDMAFELVLRSYPTERLERFMDGYVLAMEDVARDLKMFNDHGLTPQQVVDSIFNSVEVMLDQARDTRDALLNKELLPGDPR